MHGMQLFPEVKSQEDVKRRPQPAKRVANSNTRRCLQLSNIEAGPMRCFDPYDRDIGSYGVLERALTSTQLDRSLLHRAAKPKLRRPHTGK